MKSLNRSAALVFSTLLAGTFLTGCGDEDKSSDRLSAAETACRAFYLGGGATGDGLVENLRAIISEGSYEAPPLLAEIREVRQGAAEAGKTADLPDEDYASYRGVVAAAAKAEGDVLAVTDSRSIDISTADGLRTALDEVGKRCG